VRENKALATVSQPFEMFAFHSLRDSETFGSNLNENDDKLVNFHIKGLCFRLSAHTMDP
jgi:hypothetical protein